MNWLTVTVCLLAALIAWQARKRVRTLTGAIGDMAQHLGQIDAGFGGEALYAGFGCGDIDALLRLLVLAGHTEIAAEILALHAESDEDVDLHFHLANKDGNWPPPGWIQHAALTYVKALA